MGKAGRKLAYWWENNFAWCLLKNVCLGWRMCRSGGQSGAPTGRWGRAAQSQLCLASSQELWWLRARAESLQWSGAASCHSASKREAPSMAYSFWSKLKLWNTNTQAYFQSSLLITLWRLYFCYLRRLWMQLVELYNQIPCDRTLQAICFQQTETTTCSIVSRDNFSGKWDTWGSPGSTFHSCPQRIVFMSSLLL